MMSRVRLLILLAVALCALPARAEKGHVSLVPWKIAEPGVKIDAPLVLYWLPATRDELRRSDLLVSRELAFFSSHCVAMRVVRADDTERIVTLQAEEFPLAVLVERGGAVIGRVESRDGRLSVGGVEALVRDELNRRAEEAEAMLDRARVRVSEGDVKGGAALYRAVRQANCLVPRQGRDAERALRRMKRHDRRR